MKDAVVNAQKTCDKMVREAEAKCAQMLSEANAAAARNVQNADVLAAAEEARVEEARVEEARRLAAAKIDELEEQLRACLQALDRIKSANQPAAPAAYNFSSESSSADAVADEISQSLEALVGTTEDVAPKAEPKHPINDSTTSRFANMSLQVGRNYEPKK